MPISQLINIDNNTPAPVLRAVVQLDDVATVTSITYDTDVDTEVILTPSTITIETLFGTTVNMTGTIQIFFEPNTIECDKIVNFIPLYVDCPDFLLLPGQSFGGFEATTGNTTNGTVESNTGINDCLIFE